MQLRHAALAFGVHARERGLGLHHGLVLEAADQSLGISPGFLVGLAHDHMQANTELDAAAMARSLLAHIGNLLGDFCRWLTPGQIGIDLLRRQIMGRCRRAAEIHGRIRLLQRREQQLGALDAQMLAFEIQRLAFVAARQNFTPDPDELGRLLIARGMVEENAIAFEFGLIAARDQIDQQASLGETVKAGRHARRQTGLVQTGAHGHQKLEAFGYGQQAGSHHPGVFAGTARGNQHPFVAQAVGSNGDLLDVVMAELARAFAGAQIARIAVGGNEPENLHEISPQTLGVAAWAGAGPDWP